MNSELYVVFEDSSKYSEVVRMTKEQAKAINWLIDEFELHIALEPAEECDCIDLSEDYDE